MRKKGQDMLVSSAERHKNLNSDRNQNTALNKRVPATAIDINNKTNITDEDYNDSKLKKGALSDNLNSMRIQENVSHSIHQASPNGPTSINVKGFNPSEPVTGSGNAPITTENSNDGKVGDYGRVYKNGGHKFKEDDEIIAVGGGTRQ